MKKTKLILLTLVFLSGSLYAYGDYPKKKVDLQNGPSAPGINKDILKQPIKTKFPIKIPPPTIDWSKIPLPCRQGEVSCDMNKKCFRRCGEDGYLSAQVCLSPEEGQIVENCMRECVPGQYGCNLRDHDYRICSEEGKWWPGGNGWARIPYDSNPELAAQIREICLQQERNGDQQCYPGQYRCFNDGGYNICGEGGFWSESGNTSRDFGSFLNLCAFPRNR